MLIAGNFKAKVVIWTDVDIDCLETFCRGLTINICKSLIIVSTINNLFISNLAFQHHPCHKNLLESQKIKKKYIIRSMT